MGAARYEPYPAYKPSGVEWSHEFPDEWEATRFKNLFTIKKRIAGKIGPDVLSITQKGIKVKDLESGEGQLASDYSKYQHVYAGDFAMNHMDLLTGYVDISKYDGVTSPDYRVFSLDRDDCHPAFYLYILQHCYHAKIFFPLGQGAAHLGRWRLPAEAFNTFVAPVPSLREQTKIAAFLDYETGKIDALIAKQERLIALLEEKRQAVISHAVTKGLDPTAPLRPSGIDWLGDVPEHWEVSRLGYFANKIGSGKTPRGGSEVYQTEGVLFLRSQNVYNDGLRIAENEATFISSTVHEEMKGTKVLSGDILLNITGGSIGRTCIVPNWIGEANVNQHVCIIRCDESIREFLAIFLKSDVITSQVDLLQVGGNREGLNFEQIAKLVVCVPPEDERAMIVDSVEKSGADFIKLLNQAQSAITLLKERRTALISAAVTGKIDVRDWQPPQPPSDRDLSTETLQEAAL